MVKMVQWQPKAKLSLVLDITLYTPAPGTVLDPSVNQTLSCNGRIEFRENSQSFLSGSTNFRSPLDRSVEGTWSCFINSSRHSPNAPWEGEEGLQVVGRRQWWWSRRGRNGVKWDGRKRKSFAAELRAIAEWVSVANGKGVYEVITDSRIAWRMLQWPNLHRMIEKVRVAELNWVDER